MCSSENDCTNSIKVNMCRGILNSTGLDFFSDFKCAIEQLFYNRILILWVLIL